MNSFFIFQCLSLPLWYISTLVPRVALDAGLSWYEGGVSWDTHMPLSIAAFLRYFITYIRSILLTYTGTHNIPLCIACLRRVTLGFFLLKPWVAVPGIAGMGGGCFQHSGQIAPLGSHLSPRQWTGLGQNRAVSWEKKGKRCEPEAGA